MAASRKGVGQALMESVVYDEDGQMMTGSYMDYGLPRASDLAGRWASKAIRCRRAPIRWAPKAAARRDAPDRCRR